MDNNSPKEKSSYTYPRFMLIPSLSCQANCDYCFGPNEGLIMKTEMVPDIVDYMEQVTIETGQDSLEIIFHGGEPLLAGIDVLKQFLSRITTRFGSEKISYSIQSNLWLLDAPLCELFVEYNVAIGTSLDGPKEINDSQRGHGYFDKTMKSIYLARSYGLDVSCIATFTSASILHWQEVFDFFIKEKIHFNIHPTVSSLPRGSGYEITSEQYIELFKSMFEYYLQHSSDIKISTFDQFCIGILSGQGDVCTYCDCFGLFVALDPHGDIYSCQRLAGNIEYRLGNIRNKPTLKDLTNSEVGNKLIQRQEFIKDECIECTHYDYCTGGCAYNALSLTGDWLSVDPHCGAYKELFSYIKDKVYEDMISEDNLDAITLYGPTEYGNPLLRNGNVINLAKNQGHPYNLSRTAKRIIAAYELGKNKNIGQTAEKLVQLGICKTYDSSIKSLQSMLERMSNLGLGKLYLHVTWKCQMACNHCYANGGGNVDTTTMTANEIFDIILKAQDCGFREVVLTGGEPLCLPDIDDLMQLLIQSKEKTKSIQVILRTNFAMELTNSRMEQMPVAFDEIVISVDGDESTHDNRRGVGAYENTVNNLKVYMQALGDNQFIVSKTKQAKLSLSASLTKNDAMGYVGESVKALAKELDIPKTKFRPLLPIGRGENLGSAQKPQPLQAHMSILDLIERGFNPVISCGIGQNLYVEPSGDAYPCYAYHPPKSYLGNIIKNGLANVVKGDKFISLRNHTVDTKEKCRLCEYRYLCGGACRAWGDDTTSINIDAAPPSCDSLKLRAENIYYFAQDYLSKLPDNRKNQ